MQKSALTGTDTPGLEAIKWLAFLLMVGDHLARYALPGLGPVPWLLGRLVFPLFAIALGVGVSRRRDLHELAGRLVLWGCVAQGATLVAVPQFHQLNVLFTFAAGVALVQLARARGRALIARIAGAVAIGVASVLVEYGTVGVLLVACAVWAGAEHATGEGRARAWSKVALFLAVALLWPINQTPTALLALPVAWALLRWPIELPRFRRLFYRGYAAQWLLVAFVAWWAR